MRVSLPQALARIGNTFLGHQHSSFRSQALLWAWAFFSFSSFGLGQSPSISVILDPEAIVVGQTAVLTITISSHQKLEEVKPPDFAPLLPACFQISYLGTKKRYSFVNGQSSVLKIWSYSLIPQEEGSFTLSDFVLPFNGKSAQIKPVTITVTPRSQLQDWTGSQKDTWSRSGFTDPFYGGAQKIEANIDKQSPFVGEQVTYTFRYLHTAIVPSVNVPKYQLPSMNQFWKYQLGESKSKMEIIGGERFRVTEIEVALFPMIAGITIINPSVLTLPTLAELSDQFIPRQLETEETIKVIVRSLPEIGRPTSFEGIVGKYQIASEVEKTVAGVGEAIAMHVRISGIGNIETLPDLKVPEGVDLVVYDSNIIDTTQDTNGKISGTRTYGYVIIPASPGRLEIPVIEVSYFDPDKEKYEIIRTTPIPLEILPETEIGAKIAQADSISGSTKTSTRLGRYGVFAWSFGALFIVAIGSIFVIRILKRKLGQVEEQKLRQLDAYDNVLTGLDKTQSFADLANVIYGYISDNFGGSSVGLNPEVVKRKLLLENISELSTDEVVGILRKCDMVMFAPATTPISEFKVAVERSKSVVGRIEEELKKKE